MDEEPVPEEPFIELPPPETLIEDDPSFSTGENIGESMLVEYDPAAKKEEVLKDIADFMISEGKDIIIVSTQPSVAHYNESYKATMGVRIIDLPHQSGVPKENEIPMTNLEYFSEIFEEVGGRHVLIFDSLSNLILHIGVAQAYRFVSETLSKLSNKGSTLIVFINKIGHDQMDISNFENLFMNIAVVEEGKLKKVK